MKTLFSLVLLAALALGTSSCGDHPKVARAEQVFIDCARTDISQAVSEPFATAQSVIEAVVAALMGGNADWQASLEAIGKKVGSDTLACAVKAAESLFTAHADGSPLTAASPGAVRADAFLKAHPEWVFAADAK